MQSSHSWAQEVRHRQGKGSTRNICVFIISPCLSTQNCRLQPALPRLAQSPKEAYMQTKSVGTLSHTGERPRWGVQTQEQEGSDARKVCS